MDEKEDEIREALGVDRGYFVDMEIPIRGVIHTKVFVTAINPDEARSLAVEHTRNRAFQPSEVHYHKVPTNFWVTKIKKDPP